MRAALMASLPYGYCTVDTPDFLDTPYKLVTKHVFRIHGKKTFLQPVLYSIPILLRIPALIVIPLAQHVFGLVAILLVGGICRFWFYQWKWFVVPLTLLLAVNPAILWYEHTLMAEALYMDCMVLLVFAASVFVLRKSWHAFALLCVALFLTAGSRPEGKLMFGFGIVLVIVVLWRERAMFRKALIIILALALGTNFVTRTDQAGLLLYTSVAFLTPAHLKSAPGFENYIAPLQQRLLEGWKKYPTFARVSERKEIAKQVNAYFLAHPGSGHAERDQDINHFCKKLAYETCLRALPKLPMLAYYKFRYTAADASSWGFDEKLLVDRQADVFAEDTGHLRLTMTLSKGLIGRQLHSREETVDFVHANYVPARVAWFQNWHDAWHARILGWRLPDWKFHGSLLYGIPYFYLIALLGILASMFRRDVLQPVRILWALNFLGLFFIIMLTANVKARFRFVFEPFWYFYILLLLDVLVFFARKPFAEKSKARVGDPIDR